MHSSRLVCSLCCEQLVVYNHWTETSELKWWINTYKLSDLCYTCVHSPGSGGLYAQISYQWSCPAFVVVIGVILVV